MIRSKRLTYSGGTSAAMAAAHCCVEPERWQKPRGAFKGREKTADTTASVHRPTTPNQSHFTTASGAS